MTDPDVNTIGRETVENWMILRGYANWHRGSIQGLLFEIEAQAKGRGGPPEPPPGEGDWKIAQRRIEQLELENWQLKGALGYPVPGHIPVGPFKCGLCEAKANAEATPMYRVCDICGERHGPHGGVCG